MKVTALGGGVGAAKLVSGLARELPAGNLTVVVNTGDDFRWYGLYVCPDLDTILYTLSGLENPATGWGVRDETFQCLDRLGHLGLENWFRLGDRDLATHIYRTWRMQEGASLSEVTAELCARNGVSARILPMTDAPVPTLVHTDEGVLDFQEYFVHRNCLPRVHGLSFQGSEKARPAPGVLQALRESDAVILCPSNPFLSIHPILAVPGVRDALRSSPSPSLAISPLVAGKALKGPAATLLAQMGHEPSAAGVASLYRDFLDIFVLDERDESLRDRISSLGMKARSADTVMIGQDSRTALANSVLKMLR